MSTLKTTSKRPLVFLGVGVINTLLDFGFYTFLTSTVFKDGSSIALAGLLSGSFALVCAFITHGLITWRGTKISYKTLLKFIAFTGFGMWVIRPVLLSLFIHLEGLYNWAQQLISNVGIDFSYNFVANTGAFAFMLVFVLTYNYFVYSRYVFTEKVTHTEPKNHSTS